MTYRYAPQYGVKILQLVVLVEALIRGLAYVLTPQVSLLVATDITESAPVYTWGAAFLFFSVLGLFGEALMSGANVAPGGTPRAWPSFIAHAGLMILYATLTLAYANAVFNGQDNLASAPAAVAAFAYVHWMFARKRSGHVS
ncbi:membrane protein [Mycobacterium phage Refuge]|uniref:Membrane protein n=1 Tax=Mycobacterium phage Refuge TaxID=2517967 RepID=A0A482JBT0_9CAUD|nr:minor tail protein [Mycobacterium phage Refuge]QBP31053.1 membrane protein [Mycobacterium phage Refuge]